MRRGNNISNRSAFRRDTRGDRKRKFPDARSHQMQNVRPSACSEPRERVQDSRSDGAKTSEFAYFKKLKREAARGELRSRDREKMQFTDVESNHYGREKRVKLQPIFSEPKSSVPIGTKRSGDQPCLTPPVRAPKSSEINNMVETSYKDIILPLLNEKVTIPSNHNHWPSFSRSSPNNTGVQHCDKGIFGLKRQRLLQWVSGTLHKEIDELSSEGFSLVSMLLNRLFPEDNKENRDWEPKYSQADISAQDQSPNDDDDSTQHSRGHYGMFKYRLMESEDAAYEDYSFTQNLYARRRDVVLPDLETGGGDSPLTSYPVKSYSSCINMKPYHKIDAPITENFFPESNSARNQLPLLPRDNIHSMGHWRKHTNHLVEFENAGYQDYGFTRYMSESHSDVILPESDNVDADFPSTTHPIKTYFPCTYVKSNPYRDASFTESLFQESNPCFQLQLEKYGSIALGNHPKNFDTCNDTNDSLIEGEPHALLLGWDHSSEKDEQDLSISFYNRNVNLLAHSGDTDHWQSHHTEDENALSSSSLVSSYFLNCNSLVPPSSTNFCSTSNSGRYFEYEDCLYAKLDHFPVPFSCDLDSLKYLYGPSEDFSMNNHSEFRSDVLSSQDHFWNLNKVICENSFHDQESLFFSTRLDRELGEKHLTVSDYSTKNQLSLLHAYQSPQHVGPSACIVEEDKECFLYDPSCTSDYPDGLNFQDLSALNIERARDTRVSLQRHRTSCGFPILESYHTEADEDNECEFD
ncbi:hypothetical protein ACET3Z_000051 [Daucus carota]